MRRAGFTLVETLAVVTIIALLAALLFPVGQTSIAEARRTACAGNLHQIGIATGLYLADNDDAYPEVVNFYTRYAKGLSFGRPYRLDPRNYESPVRALGSYVTSAEVFKCPDDQGGSWGGTMYIFKPTLWKWNDGTSYLFSEFFEHQTSTTLSDPSQMVWSCDGGFGWHMPKPIDPPYPLWSNQLFFDGHVVYGKGSTPHVPIDQLHSGG